MKLKYTSNRLSIHIQKSPVWITKVKFLSCEIIAIGNNKSSYVSIKIYNV